MFSKLVVRPLVWCLIVSFPVFLSPVMMGQKKPAAKSAAAGALEAKPAAESQRLLPPIIHDFSSILDAATETATPEQIKAISALVLSDKGAAYTATIQALGSGFAVVVNPVPAGETPATLVMTGREGSKPPVTVQLAAAQVTKNTIIQGNFRHISAEIKDYKCDEANPCAVMIDSDRLTVVGKVTALRVSPSQISVTYLAPPASIPAYLRILDAPAQNPTVEIPPAKPAAPRETVSEFRQIIGGDFCQRNEKDDCTTSFLKPATASQNPGDPHFNPKPDLSGIHAFVTSADDLQSAEVTLQGLGPETADIAFTATSGYRPAWLALTAGGQSYRYAYTPAAPIQSLNLNYESPELSKICEAIKSAAGHRVKSCADVTANDLRLTCVSRGSQLGFVAMQDNLLIVRVTAPMGLEPTAIVVAPAVGGLSIVARRALKPGGNVNILNVDMTIMDQTTAMRNYGNRIAKRYIAVSLDVRNPTSKKVQFNKSAMYFDVDYTEAKETGKSAAAFCQKIATLSALGLYQPSVYKSPFVANGQHGKQPRVARFGLEQNVKHAPLSYQSALGSFDHTAELTDKQLQYVELFGSVMSAIATGGIVADKTGAFGAATAILTSTFLPGARKLILDTAHINRLRSNLVQQTLQETIQVPPSGSAETIVLLPRTGILAYLDAEVPVMVNRIIDVHLIPEVVTEVTETPVQRNVCKEGYTREQARQALGEPTGVTANPDGSSAFTFSKGAVASADFSVSGRLTGCKSRTPAEQLRLAVNLPEAMRTLSDLTLSPARIDLTDGSTVLADIPGVQETFHFDAKGNLAPPYVFLFDAIAGQKGQPKSAFDSFLQDKAKALSAARAKHIAEIAELNIPSSGNVMLYPSPDVQEGFVRVVFNAANKIDNASTIKEITFVGPKPGGAK